MNDLQKRYSYNFPTLVRFGNGVIDELAAYLQKHGLKSPLLVTDPNVAELGFFKTIDADLQAAGLKTAVFFDMHKNPVKSDVLAGKAAYNKAGADCIVGIGGGVAMDVARAIALSINHHRDLFDYDDLIGGDKYVTNEIPHLVTVPTTSGTGSEVGRSAIISEDESKKKRILFHPRLMASMVFADPTLTYDLPPFITAATGMDALTHNMEAYLAKGFSPLCDGIALEGIKLITRSIVAATKEHNADARAEMLMGSLMGATAFQKGLGIVHSLAHPLSTLLDMHHGLANAIMIPYGMEFNIEGQEARFRDIAIAMGLQDHTGEAVCNALHALNRELGMPAKLSGAGVAAQHIERLSDLALADFCHPSNPKPVTRADFKAIYLKAL